MKPITLIVCAIMALLMPHYASANECDKACSATVVDEIDAAVTQLSTEDQQTVAFIKGILMSEDIDRITQLRAGYYVNNPVLHLDDPYLNAFWEEVVYTAFYYTGSPSCDDRRIWEHLYSSTWSDDPEERHAKAALNNRAKIYVEDVLNGSGFYNCREPKLKLRTYRG